MKQITSILLGVILGLLSIPAQAAPDRPNVIVLFIDDLGYGDTGPFGRKDIPTPNINRLAKEGTTLTHAYVTNPPCCPNRYSSMTDC